jgi:hypothetical protein
MKSLVSLNWYSESGREVEEKCPPPGVNIYFTTYEEEETYYKGSYSKGKFHSDEGVFIADDVSYWGLVNDPTILERICMRHDRKYHFYKGGWEYQDGFTYYECLEPIGVADLGLSTETENLVKDYIQFFEECIATENWEIEDDTARHNVDQFGLFVYAEVLKELGDKYYIVYMPFNDDFSSDKHNFPFIIDNNLESTEWVTTNNLLPQADKLVHFQLDCCTGEFRKGYVLYNNTFCDKDTEKVYSNVYRWTYYIE